MKKTFLISVLSLIFSMGMYAAVTTTTNIYVEDNGEKFKIHVCIKI